MKIAFDDKICSAVKITVALNYLPVLVWSPLGVK